MSDEKPRPAYLQVPMRPRDWDELDELVELSGAPNMSEAMRASVRSVLWRLKREAERVRQVLRDAIAESKA